MPHQQPIALLGLGAPLGIQGVDGGAQMIGPMLTRHAAHLPQARLDALDQRLEALREVDLEQPEQGLTLQCWILLEVRDQPRPVVGERVRPRPIGARLLTLAGQLAPPLVSACGAHAHAGAGRRLFLGVAFGAFMQHQEDLRVSLHRSPFSATMVRRRLLPAPQAAALIDMLRYF